MLTCLNLPVRNITSTIYKVTIHDALNRTGRQTTFLPVRIYNSVSALLINR